MLSFFRIRWARYRAPRFLGSRQPCRLCGSDDPVVISRRDRWFNPLVNVMCRHCGLVYLNPMPGDEDVDNYYKYQFWQLSQGADEPGKKALYRDARNAERQFSILAPFLRPNMRILDVGSGSGELLLAARRRGYEVEGIEPNQSYARYCERVHGLKVHAAPMKDVDLAGRTFDLIISNHVLEHMRDPLDTLRRFHAALNPDGYLYLSVPNLAEPDRWPLRNFHIGHLHGFVDETLTMMCVKAGFAPVNDRQRYTSMIFRRLPAPDPNWFRFPGYAAKAEAMFRKRTIARYLLASQSYRRIPARAWYFLNDFMTVGRRSLRSLWLRANKSA